MNIVFWFLVFGSLFFLWLAISFWFFDIGDKIEEEFNRLKDIFKGENK